MEKLIDASDIEISLEQKLLGLVDILDNLTYGAELKPEGFSFLAVTLKNIINDDLAVVKKSVDYTYAVAVRGGV